MGKDDSEFKLGIVAILVFFTLVFAYSVFDMAVKHTCIEYMVNAKYAATDIVLVCRGSK